MFRGVRAKLSALRADTRGVVLYLVALLMAPFVAIAAQLTMKPAFLQVIGYKTRHGKSEARMSPACPFLRPFSRFCADSTLAESREIYQRIAD